MNPQQYPYPPQGSQNPYPPQQGPYPPQPGYGGQQPAYPPGQVPPSQMSPGQYPSGPPMGPDGQMTGQPPAMPGYNPYPYPGELGSTASKGPNKIILGVIAVSAILVILVAVLSMGGGGDNQPSQSTQTDTSETTTKITKDVEPRSDGRLELSNKVNLSKSLKAQTIQGKIKEQVNLSSGFSFMVTKIEDYVSPNPATKPAANKRFIVATTLVGNRVDGSNLSVSYLDFRLRDESNVAIAGHVTTNEILNNSLSSPNELKPGEQLTGKIIFEVDATDTDWVLIHSETYQKTTDNTSFTVEGEIVLELPLVVPETTPAPAP